MTACAPGRGAPSTHNMYVWFGGRMAHLAHRILAIAQLMQPSELVVRLVVARLQAQAGLVALQRLRVREAVGG